MPPSIRDKLVALALLDARRVAGSRPLAEHLEDFRRSLEAKANSEGYVRTKIARVRKLFEACRFRFWSDISASRIQSHLWERRKTEAKFSAQTFNFYLQAVKQFCQWMVRDRRATESPVAHLTGLNVKTDRIPIGIRYRADSARGSVRARKPRLTTGESRRRPAREREFSGDGGFLLVGSQHLNRSRRIAAVGYLKGPGDECRPERLERDAPASMEAAAVSDLVVRFRARRSA